MSSSFYIYETIEDYVMHYPTGTQTDFEAAVEHIILKNDNMIRIVVAYDTGRIQPKPPAVASIAVLLGGHEQYLKFWEESDEVVAKAYYTPKDDQIILESINYKFYKKCDRFMGKRPTAKFWKKKYDIHPKYMFFDVSRNRINFIMSNPDSFGLTEE